MADLHISANRHINLWENHLHLGLNFCLLRMLVNTCEKNEKRSTILWLAKVCTAASNADKHPECYIPRVD